MSVYFTYSPLTAATVARAADINSRFNGVSAGFDMLPAPSFISEDRVTYSVDTGTANAHIATPGIPVTAYNAGLRIRLKAANANTGAATVNVSGLGVKNILRSDGTALQSGDIKANQILDLTYDGTNFQLSMAFAEMSAAGVATKISQAGNITVNGSLTATSLVNNANTINALTAFGVSMVHAANASAGRTLLALGTMATETAANYALLASPALTGVPTAPTAATADNSTTIATTAHVKANLTGYASLASPAFTGTPTAPTAAVDTNTTQLATTGYVVAQGYLKSATASSTYAPLASPALTGTPTAPTAVAGTNTTQIATTAFVTRDFAILNSPAFTGTPTAPTAAGGTNTTQIATTAFVQSAVGGGGGPYAQLSGATFTGPVITVASAAGAAGFRVPHGAAPTTPANGDLWTTTGGLFAHINTATVQFAPLASPALTGTPTAPTAAADTNTTQIATTAYVVGQSYAKLASPTFTGVPAAPTAAASTNTTQIATTAFVLGQANSTDANILMNGTRAAGTSALYARADHVHASDTSRAPLASPAFTGTPTAPTPATGDNSTTIPTTAYVQANLVNYVTTGTLSSYAQLAGAAFTGNISTTGTLGFGNRLGQHLNLYSTTYGAGIQTNTLYLRSAVRHSFYVAGSHLDAENSPGTGGTVALTLTATAATFSGSVTATSFAGNLNMADAASGTLAVARGGTGVTASTGTGSNVLSADPALTGVPTAPTAAVDTNTTQLATTAYVVGQAYLKSATASSTYAPIASPTFTGTPAAPTPATADDTTKLATTAYVKANLTSYAPLASPGLTGTPTAPTAAADTNTTQLATTAYVVGQGYLKSSTASTTYAPLASPALTGTPTAPTAGADTSTTQLATTAFVDRLRDVPQEAKTAAYQLVLADRGKHISITTGGITVPANASVAFPIGTVVTIYNDSGSTQTIAITTDTLRLAGTATTGSRTLAQRGVATLLKVKSTEWVASGNVT